MKPFVAGGRAFARAFARRLALLLQLALLVHPQNVPRAQARPLLGAQVWIEPGQQPAEVERWFRTLAEAHLPVARLFLMWNYIERAPGLWDFSLYDRAFRAAEKYHVKIVATLTPNWGPPHRRYLYAAQGGLVGGTEEQLAGAREYVSRVVARYRESPSLDTWMLMNEPGQAPAPDPLALARYRPWLAAKYGTVERLDAAWLADFASFDEIAYDPRWSAGGFAFTAPAAFVDWYTFWRSHLTWYLGWVAAEVRKADGKHPLHVNPHALVGNLAANSFDLPAWRAPLDSLGASIHPAWHFGLLRRDQFALGVSYVADLVRGASEPRPFWITELQGGGNVYSSVRPLSPTREEIAQWVWTGVGAGADRVIFWLLNARAQGSEAGEWSLLDFQGRPSERFEAAREIAGALERNAAFFNDARPVDAPVTVILSLETMTLQDRYRVPDFAARDRNAHVLEALGFYQALAELGVSARLKQIDDFDWRSPSPRPRLVILPHVSALTAAQARDVEAFVRAGNTVLVTGLTGFYDEGARFWPASRWPLEALVGARPKEVNVRDEQSAPAPTRPAVVLSQPAVTLPSQLWVGEIDNESAEVIGREGGRVTAVRRRAGRGEVVWIPSPVGLGAWLGDGALLARLLESLAEPFTRDLPFGFTERQPGCLMRVLRGGGSFVTVVTNGTAEPRRCCVRHPAGLAPQLLWGETSTLAPDSSTLAVDSSTLAGDAQSAVSRDSRLISLGARQTAVLLWK